MRENAPDGKIKTNKKPRTNKDNVPRCITSDSGPLLNTVVGG